jgi:hypothetical protein
MEVVTLPLTVLGAVLGVLNTWRAMDRDRVKLRVGHLFFEKHGIETLLSRGKSARSRHTQGRAGARA